MKNKQGSISAADLKQEELLKDYSRSLEQSYQAYSNSYKPAWRAKWRVCCCRFPV